MFLKGDNEKLTGENETLSKKIQATLQKIDVNALLKEVDVEDLKLLDQNNKNMNQTMKQLIKKWETINGLEN